MIDNFKDKLVVFDIARIPAKNDTVVYKNLTKMKFDEILTRTLASMKPDYRMIIEKSFLKDDKIWWYEFYNKSTYYKRRNIALSGFFIVFDSLVCSVR